MIYERFIRIGVIGPALVLVVPITLRILLFVLNFLTVDFGGVAFVVLSATAAAVVVTVKHFASSNEFFWESIFTNMSKLSYAIAFAAFITRLVFAPMLEWLLGWTSASALPLMLPTFVQSFWMTCIMLLLDTAVAMRYVGPLSIGKFTLNYVSNACAEQILTDCAHLCFPTSSQPVVLQSLWRTIL